MTALPAPATTEWSNWLARAGGQASTYLFEMHGIRMSPSGLANLATKGGGPAFHRDGNRCVYAREDLDAWAKNRMRKITSTSELRKLKALPEPAPAPAAAGTDGGA